MVLYNIIRILIIYSKNLGGITFRKILIKKDLVMIFHEIPSNSIYSSAEKSSRIIEPNLQVDADYLMYWRFYKDGDIFLFSNDPSIREYIWLESNYQKAPWLFNLYNLSNRTSFSDLENNCKFSKDFISLFNIVDSHIFVNPTINYIEVIVFSTCQALVNIEDLYKIFMIRNTVDQAMTQYETMGHLKNSDCKHLFSVLYHDYITSRVNNQICGKDTNRYNGLNDLRQTEVMLLFSLCSGMSIKQYSNTNNISIKTAYKRLEIIKEKVHESKTASIITDFLDQVLTKSYFSYETQMGGNIRNFTILKQYANGLSVKDIAKVACKSTRTIESIIYHFRKRYQIDNKVQISVLMSYLP